MTAEIRVLIVIPARFASTRLPGKPLIKIAGIEMIKRVALIAQSVCRKINYCDYVVATDDQQIVDYCNGQDIKVAMSSPSCQSGTERCWDLVSRLEFKPQLIINLQGDNPLCPPWFIEEMITSWQNDAQGEVFTPFVQLKWEELDGFFKAKAKNPFSGTTVLIDKDGYAIVFSKQPLPAIRNREKLEKLSAFSPIRRHIGLYGYTFSALSQYFHLPPGQYEGPEGLEQLRFIENRIPVKMYQVDYRGRPGMNGIDSPDDVTRAEQIISEFGEYQL